MTDRKLVEVALPLEAINVAAKEDKDRKTGTIRNLHKWFAPMPVPALRALIFSSLANDPGNEEDRDDLLKLVERLVASVVDDPDSETLKAARALISESTQGGPPVVFDPFCGGGSTLVEAQRLGLKAIGSDLNPVPVLISKMLTELPALVWNKPRVSAAETQQDRRLQGHEEDVGLGGLFADIEHYSRRVYETARQKVGHLYPAASNGDPVIAYWWARTVESPDPSFAGSHTPLVNGWWLSKKQGAQAHVWPLVDREQRQIRYEIRQAGTPAEASKNRCLFSSQPINFKYVREQGTKGKLGLEMLAVVSHGEHGRNHFSPDKSQLAAAGEMKPSDPIDLALPAKAIGFRVQGYGMSSWSDLFNDRQAAALEAFAEVVGEVFTWVKTDGGDDDQATAVSTFLGLCVGKLAQANSALVRWNARATATAKAEPAFGRHDLSMTWDFAETNPFGGSVGDWMQVVETAKRALNYVHAAGPATEVRRADAREAGKDLDKSALLVTDPPYFSAIGYANLSDYFYIWIRKALRHVHPTLTATIATPKGGELIAEPARHQGDDDSAKQYFIDGFTEVFSTLQGSIKPHYPALIVYAYKEQEQTSSGRVSAGWEAMLEAVIKSGHTITATWPIHGTGSRRMVGLDTNALATYVVLAVRPRPDNAPRTTQAQFTAEARQRIREAYEALKAAETLPTDIDQALIGPGMEVFSKFSAVLDHADEPFTVRDALLMISRLRDEVADEQDADFDAATRWAVSWYEEHGFSEGESGRADALARTRVTSLDHLMRAGIIEAVGGKTRLLKRAETVDQYDPSTDKVPTAWEGLQHMIKQLHSNGEAGAARLFAQIPNPETVRDLAYRLHTAAEKRRDVEEAVACNSIIGSWREIAHLSNAHQERTLF